MHDFVHDLLVYLSNIYLFDWWILFLLRLSLLWLWSLSLTPICIWLGADGRLPEALAAEAEAETGERDRAAAESAAAASAAAAAAAAAAAEAEAEAAAATRKFQLETIDGPEGERLRRENAILQEAVQRLSARLSNLQAANLVRSGELDRLERVCGNLTNNLTYFEFLVIG